MTGTVAIFRASPLNHLRLLGLLQCNSMRYLAYLQQDEDGVFVATCPSLPGCVSQGATRSEAQANIREAIELYLKSLQSTANPSLLHEEEVIQVAG